MLPVGLKRKWGRAQTALDFHVFGTGDACALTLHQIAVSSHRVVGMLGVPERHLPVHGFANVFAFFNWPLYAPSD